MTHDPNAFLRDPASHMAVTEGDSGDWKGPLSPYSWIAVVTAAGFVAILVYMALAGVA